MLFDMHVHSSEVSPCSSISAHELVSEYKNLGYDGFVLTDHFLKYYMEVSFNLSFEDYCRHHYDGYLRAKEAGERIGFTVLYGCELRITNTANNDYLLYGVTPDFLIGNPDIFKWKPNMIKQAADENGFLVYQAHPFRDGMIVVTPENLFGMEVCNGKERDEYRSDCARLWADKYGLHKIAGSDCHSKEQAGKCGVNFFDDIRSNEELLRALKDDKYCIMEKVKYNS